MTRLLSRLVVLALSAAALSCSPGVCQLNGDCGPGQQCLDQVCRTPAHDGGATCQQTCSADSPCGSGACRSGCCVVDGCTKTSDCVFGERCLGGICIADVGTCGTDDDCTDAAAGPYCVRSACAACRTSADCGARQQCSDSHQCVFGLGYCSIGSDCATLVTTPVCDIPNNTCVACVADGDCASGLVCSASKICTAGPPGGCHANSDCTSTPETPYCQSSSGKCVACLDASQCGAGESCRAGTCSNGSTTSCATNQDCTGTDTPYCATSTSQCVQCLDYTACGVAEACVAWECETTVGGACRSNSECRQSGNTPFCDVALGQCVACVTGGSSSQCGTGFCDNDICLYGCNQLISCLADCGSNDSCVASCVAHTSFDGQQAYRELYYCVFDYACPNTNGGICDSSSAGYWPDDCNYCVALSQDYFDGDCGSETYICNQT